MQHAEKRKYDDFDSGDNTGGSNNTNSSNVYPPQKLMKADDGTPQAVTSPSTPASQTGGSTNNNHNSNTNTTNLYFKNLSPNVTKDVLQSLASPYGDIVSCKILVNLQTGQSKCCGFVNFRNSQDAYTALTNLNGYVHDNRPMVVSYATPAPPKTTAPQQDNVYIRNLPLTYTEEDLRAIFCQYGTVVSCTVLTDNQTKQSRGVALVRFSNSNEAQEAISGTNNTLLPGATAPMNVSLARSEEEKKNRQMNRLGAQPNFYADPYGDYNNYYYAQYYAQAQQYGYPLTYSGYNPMGFGNPAIPTATVGSHMPSIIDIGNGPDSGPEPGIDATNVYVTPLPPNGDDSLLYQLFSVFGGIKSVKYVQGPSVGYGFVRFTTEGEALNAIQNMNGSNFEGKTLKVTIKTPKRWPEKR